MGRLFHTVSTSLKSPPGFTSRGRKTNGLDSILTEIQSCFKNPIVNCKGLILPALILPFSFTYFIYLKYLYPPFLPRKDPRGFLSQRHYLKLNSMLIQVSSIYAKIQNCIRMNPCPVTQSVNIDYKLSPQLSFL